MSKKKAFDQINSIADLRVELQENINYLTGYYLNSETLDAAIAGLNILTEQGQKDYLTFVHHVDKSLSLAGAAKANRYHKIPTIMAGLIYYAYYPSTITDLTLDEITILAKFSIVESLQFYENSVEYYGKPLLSTVASLSPDFMYRDGFMHLANKYLKEGTENSSVVTHFETTPLEDLKQEMFTYEQEIVKEVGKYLWK